jgi:hypothetical protein
MPAPGRCQRPGITERVDSHGLVTFGVEGEARLLHNSPIGAAVAMDCQSRAGTITAGVCAFSLASSMAWRGVVPSADPPLAGLVWFVPDIVRQDVLGPSIRAWLLAIR